MTLDDSEIRAIISQYDTTSSLTRENLYQKLKPLGKEIVPYFLEYFPKLKKWQGRVSLVFSSIKYARESEAAVKLGLLAINDKATLVRYRGCMLLAYSLKQEVIPALEKLFDSKDKETVADAVAAIDAIKHQNHHYFIHRNHDPRGLWIVNDSDRPPTPKASGSNPSQPTHSALHITATQSH